MSFSSEELARIHTVIYSGDFPDFFEKIKDAAKLSHLSKFQNKQSRSNAVNMKVFHKCDYGDIIKRTICFYQA